MMKYRIQRNGKYDFAGQSYAHRFPNLHKYPATMLPQIGVEILHELNITGGKMLDPYCGSGSSFIAGLDCGCTEIVGYDINPLAVLISKAKFTAITAKSLETHRQQLRCAVYDFVKDEKKVRQLQTPDITNLRFWFSDTVAKNLSVIKHFIEQIRNKNVRRLFFVPFSETVRECSYTRNHEFKPRKMKPEDILKFNPDVLGVYFDKLNKTIGTYVRYYLPHLTDAKIRIRCSAFIPTQNSFDVVLTSPPYGDSKTTVAYGQFSTFSNEWLGVDYARKVDWMLMGGKATKNLYPHGVIKNPVQKIAQVSPARALQISSFYEDLGASIRQVAGSVRKNGKAIYVVGNRLVKNTTLPTDQFIAEQFEQNGCKHLFTYERKIGNKAMPSQNSPSNQKNQKASTMTHEYIIVCQKTG